MHSSRNSVIMSHCRSLERWKHLSWILLWWWEVPSLLLFILFHLVLDSLDTGLVLPLHLYQLRLAATAWRKRKQDLEHYITLHTWNYLTGEWPLACVMMSMMALLVTEVATFPTILAICSPWVLLCRWWKKTLGRAIQSLQLKGEIEPAGCYWRKVYSNRVMTRLGEKTKKITHFNTTVFRLLGLRPKAVAQPLKKQLYVSFEEIFSKVQVFISIDFDWIASCKNSHHCFPKTLPSTLVVTMVIRDQKKSLLMFMFVIL